MRCETLTSALEKRVQLERVATGRGPASHDGPSSADRERLANTTLTQPNPATAPTTSRTLHAFPPGSNISLCGRKLSPHPMPTMTDTRHCPVCLQAAADPAIR